MEQLEIRMSWQAEGQVMGYTTRKPTFLAAVTICGMLVTQAGAQIYRSGDKVVAVVDTELKMENTVIGAVSRGQILTVAQVQDNWLWIEGKSGPEKVQDCLPSRRVLSADMTEGRSVRSITLSNPIDNEKYAGYTSTSTPDHLRLLPVRSNAQWSKPGGALRGGWIESSAVAPAISLRIEGRRLYYSLADAARLANRAEPQDGLWPFGTLHLAIIRAETSSGQSGAVHGCLFLQPLAVKQPNQLVDLPPGRYGVFLVVTPADQAPMPGSEMIVVEDRDTVVSNDSATSVGRPTVQDAPAISDNGAAATTGRLVGTAPAAYSDETRARLSKAQTLVRQEKAKVPEFSESVKSAASELPRMQLATNKDRVIWSKLILNSDGTGLDAFRFTSPLDTPADLFWAFTFPDTVGSWYIMPSDGTMKGFTDFHVFAGPKLDGLQASKHDSLVFQPLVGGEIRQLAGGMFRRSGTTPARRTAESVVLFRWGRRLLKIFQSLTWGTSKNDWRELKALAAASH